MSNILIFGSMNTVFTHSYSIAFKERGFNVSVIDVGEHSVNPSFLESRGINVLRWQGGVERSPWVKMKHVLKSSMKKLLVSLSLDRAKFVVTLLSKVDNTQSMISRVPPQVSQDLVDTSYDYVFYLWGTTVRKYKMSIDRHYLLFFKKPPPRSILCINTYPVRDGFSLETPPLMAEEDKTYFLSFDLLLFPTDVMLRLFVKMGCRPDKYLVFDDRLHPAYLFSGEKETRAVSSSKRAVFLGNTSFSERTIDNVFPQLIKIANAGIEVWIQRPVEVLTIHKNIKYFTPFTYEQFASGELAIFISEFDFVFMGYNKLRNARSRASLPTRFALAMTGLVPIFLEKNNYDGVLERFGWSNLIYCYESLDDLIDRAKSRTPASDNELSFNTYIQKYYEQFSKLERTMIEIL